jgi:hypothetical protein
MIHWAHSKNTSISRSIMAGLACGIVAAVLIVTYGYFFRKATGFSGVPFFEPMVLFIACPLLFVVAGAIFFGMADSVKKGGLLFTALFLTLTIVGAIVNIDGGAEQEGLFLGMILITGTMLSFLLPYLATHPKLFMDKQELEESE